MIDRSCCAGVDADKFSSDGSTSLAVLGSLREIITHAETELVFLIVPVWCLSMMDSRQAARAIGSEIHAFFL